MWACAPLTAQLKVRICLHLSTSNRLAPAMSIRQARLSGCVTPSVPKSGHGMLTVCPSPTARALGLGPTNPTRITLASEPLDFRRSSFSPLFRYSSQHSHFSALHQWSPSGFPAAENAPLPSPATSLRRNRGFGGVLEPRYIFRTGSLDQ